MHSPLVFTKKQGKRDKIRLSGDNEMFRKRFYRANEFFGEKWSECLDYF